MSEIKLDLKGIKLPEGTNYIKVKSQASGYNDGVSTVIPYEIKGTLYAPNVKREGDTLEVEIYFGETQYYAVYVDGVVHTVVPRDEQHTFDLSAFGLPAGTHEITIRARGVNYNESPDGTVFTYEAGEETVQISGSWKFEGDYNPTLDIAGAFKYNVKFISNGSSFLSMTVGAGEVFYDDTLVCEYSYGKNVWTNEAYRTITFDGTQTVSKSFYSWFVTSAEPYTVIGTWYFNDTLSLPDTEIYQLVDYTFSNGYTDGGFRIKPTEVVLCDSSGNNATMYTQTGGWANYYGESYRTITFNGVQNVSEEFYDWLSANAVRQEITFTIDGTSYKALSGMTWGDWIESEYNTKGFTNEQGINLDGMYLNDGYSTVYPDNTIVADRNYVLTEGGAGN